MLTDRRLIYLSLSVVFLIGPILLVGAAPFFNFVLTIFGPYLLLAGITALLIEMFLRWQDPPRDWGIAQKIALVLSLWTAFLVVLVIIF
jgi:hypothetical protein